MRNIFWRNIRKKKQQDSWQKSSESAEQPSSDGATDQTKPTSTYSKQTTTPVASAYTQPTSGKTGTTCKKNTTTDNQLANKQEERNDSE